MVAEPIVRISSGGTDYDFVALPQGRSQVIVKRPRKETPLPETLTFPNFENGLFLDRILSTEAKNPEMYRRARDATADTRWPSGVYPPLLEQDSTETGLERLRASVEFNGDLWAILEDDSSTDIVARKYSPAADPDWTGGGNVHSGANAAVGLDMIVYKNKMFAMFAEQDDHHVRYSADGATWTAPATTAITVGLLNGNVSANEEIDAGLLFVIGDQLGAAIWDQDGRVLTFFSTIDGGDTWRDEGAGSPSVDIPSTNGPLGVAVMPGFDGVPRLYVMVENGLWEVDVSAGTGSWTSDPIKSFPRGQHGRRMSVGHEGALWMGQDMGSSQPPITWLMFNDGDTNTHRFEVAPNDFSEGGGMPAESFGIIRMLRPAPGGMIASVGGNGANRNARLYFHNGQGWHSLRRHGTANQAITWFDLSDRDDDTQRLHYEVKTGAAASNTKFLAAPFVDPATGATPSRETTGYVDLPYMDGGSPVDNKNFMRVRVNASALSSGTTNQHINIDFGATTDLGTAVARNNENLGDIISSVSALDFGSGVGVSALFLGLRVNVNLGAAAATIQPAARDIQIDFIPKPTKTRGYVVLVGIAETASKRGGDDNTAAVYTDLEAIEDLVIKASLTYADIGTKTVNIEAVHYDDDIIGHEETATPDSNARRKGTAQIIMSEVAS